MKIRFMWVLAMALVGFASAAGSARAEEFTLTRGDGKVFTCTDNGSGGGGGRAVTQCDCKDQYDRAYGVVLGKDLQNQCRTLNGLTPKLVNCVTLRAESDIACTCSDQYNRAYGDVIADVSKPEELTSLCRKQNGLEPRLSKCRAL